MVSDDLVGVEGGPAAASEGSYEGEGDVLPSLLSACLQSLPPENSDATALEGPETGAGFWLAANEDLLECEEPPNSELAAPCEAAMPKEADPGGDLEGRRSGQATPMSRVWVVPMGSPETGWAGGAERQSEVADRGGRLWLLLLPCQPPPPPPRCCC